jgi:hypothetical protein
VVKNPWKSVAKILTYSPYMTKALQKKREDGKMRR